jgi:hypothetical protein
MFCLTPVRADLAARSRMMTQAGMVFPVVICGRIEPSGHTKIFDTIRLKFPDEYRTPL